MPLFVVVVLQGYNCLTQGITSPFFLLPPYFLFVTAMNVLQLYLDLT